MNDGSSSNRNGSGSSSFLSAFAKRLAEQRAGSDRRGVLGGDGSAAGFDGTKRRPIGFHVGTTAGSPRASGSAAGCKCSGKR